jgi:N-acetylglucosaminyldiphosphoundecaprenol N-acetyl-beta-D-mannosaminyltransferase
MRVQVLGCMVDNLSMSETINRIESFIDSRRPHQHVVVNADKVVRAHHDPEFRAIINQCDLINADGMPVIWASRLLRRPLKERVTGVDLFHELVGSGARKGWRLYFLGAKEEIVSSAIERLRLMHPSLIVAGYRNGYWKEEEEAIVVERIRESSPDILFVAISSPKKEEFLAKYQSRMGVPFAMGVGGTFDVVAGKTRRAPGWMRRVGLEWFYRFLQEPQRMFARYFIHDMYFFWLLAVEMVRHNGRRY